MLSREQITHGAGVFNDLATEVAGQGANILVEPAATVSPNLGDPENTTHVGGFPPPLAERATHLGGIDAEHNGVGNRKEISYGIEVPAYERAKEVLGIDTEESSFMLDGVIDRNTQLALAGLPKLRVLMVQFVEKKPVMRHGIILDTGIANPRFEIGILPHEEDVPAGIQVPSPWQQRNLARGYFEHGPDVGKHTHGKVNVADVGHGSTAVVLGQYEMRNELSRLGADPDMVNGSGLHKLSHALPEGGQFSHDLSQYTTIESSDGRIKPTEVKRVTDLSTINRIIVMEDAQTPIEAPDGFTAAVGFNMAAVSTKVGEKKTTERAKVNIESYSGQTC